MNKVMKTIKLTAKEQRLLLEIILSENVCNVSCYYNYKTDMCDKCKLKGEIWDLYEKIEGVKDGNN